MGGLFGGGGDEGDATTEVRYAPYIEDAHKAYMETIATVVDERLELNPFDDYEVYDINDTFFGAGYTITSFPSLYDMYGKFMAGLDIEVLWDQMFQSTLYSPEVSNLVSAESDLLDDNIEEKVLPRFKLGLRDVNAVMSSSFVIGEALIESARVKSISKFSAELKYRLIPIVVDRWKAHLDWNRGVITTYMEIMKLYFLARIDFDNHNQENDTKKVLWPFTLYDYKRVSIGMLNGAINSTTDVAGASRGQSILGGAMSGAGLGASIGGEDSWGAGIGAVVGGVLGAF